MVFGRHINRFYLKYAPLLLLGMAALAAVDYLQLLIPEYYRMVINGMNGTLPDFTMDFLLNRICMPMVGVAAAIIFGRFLWRITIFGAAVRVEKDLREEMFDHARLLSREFYQREKVGGLMSLYTNDLDTVQESFGWGFMQFFDALFLGSMALVKMWRMNKLLTVFSMIPMGILFAAAALVGRHMSDKWEYRQACYSELSDFTQESFSGIAVVKAFAAEALELAAFREKNLKNEKANIEYARISVLMRILVTSFVESVICIILGYGGYLVYSGVFDAGQLMEFVGYFTSIVWPVMAVSELIDMSARGRASMKRISELLDTKPDVADRPDAVELHDVKGALEVRNLTFRYPGGEYDVLRDLSFSVYPGEHIGIAGRTGSGKTTLVELLLRMWNVPDGTILIDGQDINTLTLASVRGSISCVPQDSFLFSDTIAANIAFSVDVPDPAGVRESAVLAAVDDNISEFRDGYDTVLGERGVTVSGGQKQRIAIARALLKDAPILVLDDAVSAVDTRTERTILENLRKTRKGRTTILTAHRISTLERMDRILFLDETGQAAFAPHRELYASVPAYRKMVDLQKLEEKGAAYNA